MHNTISKSKEKRFYMVIGCVMILTFLVSSLNLSNIKQNRNEKINENDFENNQNPSPSDAPFTISSNGAFATYAQSGDGTINNPYVIANKIIDAQGVSGITISGTTAYFILKNNTIFNYATYPTGCGIKLSSLSNGWIMNNTLSNGGDGILAIYCSNNNISENTISNSTQRGIYVEGSNNRIFKNLVHHSGQGIFIGYSSQNRIEENLVRDNSAGIGLWNTNNNFITGNYAINNSVGIYVEKESGGGTNYIYLNSMVNNTNYNAQSNDATVWYNSSLQKGNYYSDYAGSDANQDGIGDTAHPIYYGSNTDLYPLMKNIYISDLSIYSSFLGGNSLDQASGMTMDKFGNIYMIAQTTSTDLPTTPNCYDPSHNGGYDTYVAKFSPNYGKLIFATYIGGSGDDFGHDIAVDDLGNVYIMGEVRSTNYPTTAGVYSNSHLGSTGDVFITKFNSTGNGLIFSTYFGGSAWEQGYAILIASDYSIYVSGETRGGSFPATAGSYDTVYSGDPEGDCFISHISADGSTLLHSTFLGGSMWEAGVQQLRWDPTTGNIIGLAAVRSSGFPITGDAWDTTFNGVTWDNALIKMNPTLSTLIYSTYIGGNNNDYLSDIYVDSNGFIYVAGGTTSSNWPTSAGVIDTTFGGSTEGVIMKFNPDNTLNFSTQFGGSLYDTVSSICTDQLGNIYISGMTTSTDFATTADALDRDYNGGTYDHFLAIINPTGTQLLYSTYIGGNDEDTSIQDGIFVLADFTVMIGMSTKSSDHPISYNAYDKTHNGNSDLVIFRMENPLDLEIDDNPVIIDIADPNFDILTYIGSSLIDEIGDIVVDSQGYIYIVGTTLGTDFPTTSGALYQTNRGGRDGVFLKFNPNATEILYSTYFGGSNDDYFRGIALDPEGNAYIVGNTKSTNLPTTSGVLQPSYRGGTQDGMVLKIYSNGTLAYCTYLGGNGIEFSDCINDIIYADNGEVYISGETWSSNFPVTTGVFQTSYLGYYANSFLSRLNADATAMVASTFVGSDCVWTYLTKDHLGNIYMTSMTNYNSMPTTAGCYQPNRAGAEEFYFAKFNASLTTLIYGSYLGGSGWDGPCGHNSILVDLHGNIYLSGQSRSSNFPVTSGCYQSNFAGVMDAVFAKFDSSGNLLYSTYIGGSEYDHVSCAVLDSQNNYILGIYSTGSLTISENAWDSTYNGNGDIALLSFTNSTMSLHYGTYLGGTNCDGAAALFIDSYDQIYGIGSTNSVDFPTTALAYDKTHNGDNDLVIFRLSLNPPIAPVLNITDSDENGYVTLNWDAVYEATSYRVYISNSSISKMSGSLFYLNSTSSTTIQIKLSDGTHYIIITALNERGESVVSNCRNITLNLNIAPTINTPNDIIYIETTTGHVIDWIITDTTTSSPTYDLYRNNTFIETRSWSSGNSLALRVEHLTIGYWNYTIIVYDGLGASVTDTVWVQVIPNNPPTIESGGVTTYVYGTTNNQIQWTITDTTIATTGYAIYRNDTSMTSGSWVSGTPIQYNVDGLAPGIYNFTILAQDGIGNSSQNTVIVTVTNVNPGLTQPADFSYLETTTGHIITWTATDTTTNASRAYTILRNGTSIASGSWESGTGITISAAGLSVGHWNFTIVVTDGIGGSETDEVWVHVFANVPPSIESGGVTTYVYGTSSNLIQWTITDTTIGTTSYAIYRNGTSMTTGSWVSSTPIQYNVDGLTVGSYNFTMVAADGVGNSTQNTVILTVTNDIPTISHPEDQTWIENTPGQIITWQVTDGATATRTYTVWRNTTNSFATGSWISGTDITINLVGLAVGYHNFTIIAEDGLGGKVTDEVWVHVLANTIPTLIGPVDCMYFYGVGGNSLDWTPTDPNIYTATYTVFRNGTDITSGGWTTGVNISLNIDGLAVGHYNFTLIITDGYNGQAVDEVWVYVAPTTVPIIEPTTDITFAMGSTGYNITWIITDSTVDNPTYAITRNGVELTTGTWVSETPIVVALDGLAIGVYEYIITVDDGFGNTAQDTVWVTVENTMPQITSPLDLTYTIGTTGHYLTWTVTDPNIGITSFTIYCNGVVNGTGMWSSGQNIMIFVDNLYLGTYNFTIIVQDGLGNSTRDEVWVTVQNTIPTITHPTNVVYNIGTTGNTLAWTITDPNILVTGYQIFRNGTLNATGSWVSGSAVNLNIDGLAIGGYNYTIIATDGYGGQVTDEVLVTVQNTLPVITSPSDLNYIIGTTGHNLTWTITDTTVLTATYQIYCNGTQNATGNWNSGTPISINVANLALGVYNYTIIATDGYGGQVTDEVVVTVENTVMSITSPTDIIFDLGTTGQNITWTITDGTVATPTYSLYRNGTLAGTYEWISGEPIVIPLNGLGIGIYNYTILATDGLGDEVVDEVMVTVQNNLPTITGPADLEIAFEDRNRNLEWTVVDPNVFSPNYTIYLNGTLNVTGTWTSGTKIAMSLGNFPSGTFNITIVAADGHGATIEDQVTLTILPPNEVIPLTIHILTPANETVYRSAFGIPLAFEIRGDGTCQSYWYQLNGDEWVEISGNTSINLFQPGTQTIRVKALTDANENITSTNHTFYLVLQPNLQAGLEVIASTTVQKFVQNSMVQVKITIRNTGQIRLNNIHLRFDPSYSTHQIRSNYFKQVIGGLAPGEEITYTMDVWMVRTVEKMNFTGNLMADDLYVRVNFELKSDGSESSINLAWPIGGAGAVFAGVVVYSVYRKKSPGKPKNRPPRDSRGVPEPTMDNDVEFLL